MFAISPNSRIRKSPFYDATVRAGATSFTTYNHMLMPTGYGDAEAEYWRLIQGVSMWDVAVERQIELRGRNAARLAQILSPRDLSACDVDQGKYVALCNHAGTIINDPILLKLADDRFWLSIADCDILHWARAIAAERGLDVTVIEADVSPLAVQGPKADDVVAAIFGDWVRWLKHFRFRRTTIDGIPVAVARSGWSRQGGFELYLMDGSKGTALWDIVHEAGAPFDIGPGYPNPCERVESGLLSWGGDTDDATNPFEVRLGAYVDLDVPDDVVGIPALRHIAERGPGRHQLGVVLEGDRPSAPVLEWLDIHRDGTRIGAMTNGVWSRRMKANIGFALVSVEARPGNPVSVLRDGELVPGRLTDLPFIGR